MLSKTIQTQGKKTLSISVAKIDDLLQRAPELNLGNSISVWYVEEGEILEADERFSRILQEDKFSLEITEMFDRKEFLKFSVRVTQLKMET